LPISALPLLTILGGCTAQRVEPVAVSLPEPPAFAQPVNTLDMRKGESCWVAYRRKRGGERHNAKIILQYNEWYAEVMQAYENSKR
jgi:hypothetical protein